MAITDTSNYTYYITTTTSATAYPVYYTDTCGTYASKKSEISPERLNELLRKEAAYDAIMAERREIEKASIRSGRMIAI